MIIATDLNSRIFKLDYILNECLRPDNSSTACALRTLAHAFLRGRIGYSALWNFSGNTEKEPIPLDEIEKGQRAMAIVEISSIWFVDGKFGVSLRLQQVMVEPSAKLPAFAFNP